MHRINAEIWIFPQNPGAPLTNQQIYNIIVTYIETGIILPGSKLPSYRSVALLNNIQRNTMFRIYERLEKGGWVNPVEGAGTFVSSTFPGYAALYPLDNSIERLPIRLGNAPCGAKHDDHPPADYIMIGCDTPSPHFLSQWLFQTHIARYARDYVNFNQMDRINAMTNPGFKTAILNYLNINRRFMVNADCLSIVTGRIESLQQIFKLLLKPLDHVVTTSPRDLVLNNLIKDCNVVSHCINNSKPGFMNELKELLKHTTITALHIRPQCSHLQSHSMSDSDCIALLELAKAHRFYIIEEDDYHEFWDEIKPFKPLILRNHSGHVIYCGALSLLNTYMQQTRTIVAPSEFISTMERTYVQQSPFKCHNTEYAITLMLNDGRLLSDIRKMQKKKKRDLFEAGVQLVNGLGNVVDVVKPSAGLSYWLEFPNARILKESIRHLQQNNFNIPFHPYSGKPTFEETNVCFGFGTWDLMEVDESAKQLFEKLHPKYRTLQ